MTATGQPAGAPTPPEATPSLSVLSPWIGAVRVTCVRVGQSLAQRALGAADGSAVVMLAARELALILRSRAWHRFLGMWATYCVGLVALPVLFRLQTGQWRTPSDTQWFLACGCLLQLGAGVFMSHWSIGHIRRDLHSDRLDELMLTRCTAADITMGEGAAFTAAGIWLSLAAFPSCVLLSAIAGREWDTALRLFLSLIPVAGLGVWFGIGWGMAFTLRRRSAIIPLTKWWLLGPFLPLLVGWWLLGSLPIIWALVSFIPGGLKVLAGTLMGLRWLTQQFLRFCNPVLVVPAAAGNTDTVWLTSWLTLIAVMVFMARKSMDAMQIALAGLPERGGTRGQGEYWIHHDAHYFAQYRRDTRLQPRYYDGGNAIAAFDVALGHRVFLHPFLWCVALLLYLALLFWCLLIPELGRWAAIGAVVVPTTGAILLMSGGVAVSFGWERDQHRWSALAVLPLDNYRLTLGKIKGVVRPTLWISLIAALTALLLGWRGALEWEPSCWLALHALVFPPALACVSAALALTTPTVAEALFRWAVLGAIPALATLLPPPIGGEGGLALPFSPPLLSVWLAAAPSPVLLHHAWTSLGLEVAGIVGALLILGAFLRRWTVGERD